MDLWQSGVRLRDAMIVTRFFCCFSHWLFPFTFEWVFAETSDVNIKLYQIKLIFTDAMQVDFASSDVDETLLTAQREAIQSGRMTPILKVELWTKIQSRRLSEGKDELKVDFCCPPKRQQVSDIINLTYILLFLVFIVIICVICMYRLQKLNLILLVFIRPQFFFSSDSLWKMKHKWGYRK